MRVFFRKHTFHFLTRQHLLGFFFFFLILLWHSESVNVFHICLMLFRDIYDHLLVTGGKVCRNFFFKQTGKHSHEETDCFKHVLPVTVKRTN